MILKNIDTTIFVDYDDNNISQDKLEVLVDNTLNTWQEDREKDEKLADTSQGKLAEQLVLEYLNQNFSHNLSAMPYDSIRNDNFRKTAPFDFLIYEKDNVHINTVISAIQNDVNRCEKYGKLSFATKNLCKQYNIKITEVKSTQIRSDLKTGANFKDYSKDDQLRRLINRIKNSDHFLTYPRYCRNVDKEDYNLADYCQLAKNKNARYLAYTGDDLVKRLISDEALAQSDLFIRVYVDKVLQKGLIIGWISRDAFFDENIEMRKMPKIGKSEKALYWAKSLTDSKPMNAIDSIFS